MESFRVDLALQFERLSDISHLRLSQTKLLFFSLKIWSSPSVSSVGEYYHYSSSCKTQKSKGRWKKKIGCFHFLTTVSSKNQESPLQLAILLSLQILVFTFLQNQSQFSSHSFRKHDHFNNSQMANIAL